MKKLFLTAFVLLALVLVSQAQTKHFIGEKFGGGIVFDVSADGLHGLIAETIDQGMSDWFQAKKIAKKGIHSEAGKFFKDWYLPSKDELNKLYLQRKIVGGFTDYPYLSSTEGEEDYNAWHQDLDNGSQNVIRKNCAFLIRSIRAF